MNRINKIIQGDCLEVMKDMPDKSIDWVITDPPYGINIAKWDYSIPEDIYFNEIFRVSKNQIIFGGNLFDLPKTESWIVWYKQPFLKAQSQAELIWTSLKFKMKVFHYRYAGNCEGYPDKLKVDYKKKSVHPTEKPLEVMTYLIESFTKKDETVLDPFAGSGTTGVACKNLNRNCILIEKEPEYVDIINKRLTNLT
jgi:site-specific DNA-methyltransferase (adenine-specific)